MAIRLPKELLTDDPTLLAPEIDLVAVTDEDDGWSRRVCGRGFTYQDVDGRIPDGKQRRRIDSLVIPPAWTDVWVCPDESGYLQVTGIDAAGRKQYLYHPEYVTLMEQRKFHRLAYFPRALTTIRQAIVDDIAQPAGSRRRATATAVALIDRHLLRVGNENSAEHGHFGVTTLVPAHLHMADADEDGGAALDYLAKSGQRRQIAVDPDLAADLEDLRDRDADRLVWFSDQTGSGDDGQPRQVTATMLNDYVRTHAGTGFSTKDFRTWGGSAVALEARVDGASEVEAVDSAAAALGNTRAVARSSYVHPQVLAADDAEVQTAWASSRSSEFRSRSESALAKLVAPTR